MKKIFKTLAIVAVAALGFACQNEIDEQVNGTEGEKVTVEVVGSVADLTRSTFGEINTTDKKVPSTWSGNEKVAFSLNEAAIVSATNTDEAGATASFSVEFTNDGTTEGTIYAFAPFAASYAEGGIREINSTYSDVTVTIPAAQTPLANSVDESAHLMAATYSYTDGIPSNFNLTFEHIAAYGKMTLVLPQNVTADVVKLTFPKNVVGTNAWYYYETGTWGNVDKDVVTINTANVENNVFWFTVAPTGELTEGNIVVEVLDGTTSYTKTIALNASKKLGFVKGQVSAFKVDMSAVEGVKPLFGLANAEIVAAMSAVSTDPYQEVTIESSCGDWNANVYGGNKSALQFRAKGGSYVLSPVFEKFVEKIDITFASNVTNDRFVYAVPATIVESLPSGDYADQYDTNYGYVKTTVAGAQTLTLTFESPVKQFALLAKGGAVYVESIEVFLTDDFKVKEATTIDLGTYENTVDIKEGTKAASDNFIEPNATVVDASDVAVEGAKPTYTSNNADVATVNAENGNVTFTGGTGSVTITISYAGDDNYKGCSAEYTIKVTNSAAGGGQGESYSYSVTNAVWSAWNKGVACGAITWTPAKVTADASATVGNKDGSGRGQQFGAATSGKKLTSMTMTGTGYEGGIKSVDVSACAKRGNTVTINVTVGGVAMTSTKNSYTISGSNSSSVVTAEFTSETPLTGDIVITYTLKTQGAVYVSGFAVNN